MLVAGRPPRLPELRPSSHRPAKPRLWCLQGGNRLAFDYCLLASGSTYPAGVKPDPAQLLDRPARLQQFADIRAQVKAWGPRGRRAGTCEAMFACGPQELPACSRAAPLVHLSPLFPTCPSRTLQIEAAGSVVVVGGGSVGVEVAAEVAEAHPRKKV